MGARARFDVLVVGSGASGGWAAKRLSEAGLDVALLEAGRARTAGDDREHVPAFSLPYRDRAPEVVKRTRPVQKDCYACTEWNHDWFANDLEEPYTTAKDKPFSWQGRLRLVGGRTNVWGRHSYRLSDLDFKAASHDGYGDDWPLGYSDLAPYYDLVEEYVGISGQAEGVYELPDGRFQPPMGMHCAERRLRQRVKEKLGHTVTMGRVANLTRPLRGRAPCHYCGPCENGCTTRSYFNSAFTTVADAVATGRCTLVTNAMVYKVLTDDKNRARGVLYIDRTTREPREIEARVVVVCAQALESARILLNSANERQPNGLANSSGALGHYLMDHTSGPAGARGEFPDLPVGPFADGPNRPTGIYVIRFRNTESGPRTKKFLRGYGFQGGATTTFNLQAPGFGAAFKRAVHDPRTSFVFWGYGECLARFENHVEIDRSMRDAWGIPVLKIHMAWGPNETAMFPDMAESAAEMLEVAGARNITPYIQAGNDGADGSPGWAIHETGVARMGKDAKTSVLNAFQQTHDVDNLFVMDGSGFVSSACQNPTLTIMALAVRSTDYLLEELRKGNL